MSNFTHPRQLSRDGVSQQDRRLPALDPASAPLDERGLPELLAQVQQLADQLRWYDEQHQPDGTWSYLFDLAALAQGIRGEDAQRAQRIVQNLSRLAGYVEDPNSLPPELAGQLTQPHITLILVILQLLQQGRDHLNTLTARHMDFYYNDILRFKPRTAEPDRVHVLVTPARGKHQARLPKNSLLAAGQDASGRERVYVTEHELAVNRAQVTELRSLYADILITDPASIRRDHPTDQQLMDLLRLAIGDPEPGDALVQREGWPVPEQGLFTHIFKACIDFARGALYLEFYQLRELVRRKRIRDNDTGDWALINGVLNAVGARRTGRRFSLSSRLGSNFDMRNFDLNLETALGQAPDFSGLAEVENIDDLYRLRDRETVRAFLRNAPYNALAAEELQPDGLPVMAPDVVTMMARKQLIDGQWADINNYLNLAGRTYRNNRGFQVERVADFKPSEFERNLREALPELDFSQLPAIGTQSPPGAVTEYMTVIEQIEAYLFMDIESARFLLNRAFPEIGVPAPSDEQGEVRLRQLWGKADTILTEARGRKAIAQRRVALQALREGDAASDVKLATRAILAKALGLQTENPQPLSNLLEAARPLLSEAQYDALVTVCSVVTGAGATEDNWAELIRLAELMERTRLGQAAARLERHTWIDLHGYQDATQVIPADTDSDGDQRWRTFGQAISHAHPNQPPQPLLGWALSSPVLAMRQGRRRIQLDLEFAATEKALIEEQVLAIQALFPEAGFDSSSMALSASPLAVDISGEEGWLAADTFSLSVPARIEEGGRSRLNMRLVLEVEASSPAITAPLPELGMDSLWPVLRIRLRSHFDNKIKRFCSPYPALRMLSLEAYNCEVQVGDPTGADGDFEPELGLIEPLLRNDQSSLNPGKPFEPFGMQPATGSRLTIGDAELACKRLQTLRFGLTWMGVPNADLKIHYDNYSHVNQLGNNAYKVQVSLVDRRKPIALSAPQQLFDTKDATKGKQIVLTNVDKALSTPPPVPDKKAAKDPTQMQRYLRWELSSPDFQHAAYPTEAAKAANAKDSNGGPAPLVLNPPYTPKLKALSISYSAFSRWDPAAGIKLNDGDELFHLHPFGYSEVGGGNEAPLLPAYDNAGELLIGLNGLEPPQRLNMLLQLAEGSADPDLPPAPVSWSYLNGNLWVPLDQGQVRRDETRGLINSGIVELDLPEATTGNRLPGECYWLRLAVQGRPRSLCDSVAIATQAVSAVFVDNSNDPDHYLQPLQAESITKPVRPIAGIAGIQQPYTSFGGRPAESREALRTRSGERLRHRNRALTAWDYEHLVLERFPQLHKVKCLPVRHGQSLDPTEDLGLVRLVVIPDIARQRPASPFAPKAPAKLLKDVQDFLSARLPMGARVQVDNAVFVPVKVRVGVQFRPEFDPELARSELVKALNRYLSPWAYEEGVDIVIGGAIYANSIIDFLERQPAVDYVQQPKLFRLDGATNRFLAVPAPEAGAEDGYHVSTTAPNQVLVAARQHDIDVIQPEVDDDEGLRGIGYMKVELDLVVAEDAV